jgi:DNA photolyase
LAQNEQIFAKALVWFRRDLRTHEHGAFYHALKAGRAVYCAFVFDTEILEALPRRAASLAATTPRPSSITPWRARRRWSVTQKPGKARDGAEVLARPRTMHG